jgi:hypothetical protein
MAQHESTRDFIRQMQSPFLARYFVASEPRPRGSSEHILQLRSGREPTKGEILRNLGHPWHVERSDALEIAKAVLRGSCAARILPDAMVHQTAFLLPTI